VKLLDMWFRSSGGWSTLLEHRIISYGLKLVTRRFFWEKAQGMLVCFLLDLFPVDHHRIWFQDGHHFKEKQLFL
jgi:hypothetical protein